MIKCYVKRDGMWVQVFETHGWYDVVCWVCSVFMVVTIGILAGKNVL